MGDGTWVARERVRKASAEPVSEGMQILGTDPSRPPGEPPGGVKRDAKMRNASFMDLTYYTKSPEDGNVV